MADSNITKRALANALRELMKEKSFSKISVADICEKCGMNRKSFYYHFRDKYDLVNWIFDTDFISIMQSHASADSWALLSGLCEYFYENRDFYRKALRIEGQNSFVDHFHELLYALIHSHLPEITNVQQAGEFQVNFFSDAAVMTFQRWILSPNCMGPEEFLTQLKICIQCMASVQI
ncbi:MAG: TetR/AcrR family transcriptional regulator C-terminal domain-containing protein [Lachnospiraceae bacterium]|nr:TetR/AcrR family transcriptional regulator C-terminal domain-containing protein [Robinsoniella sp.]MDY3767876.1 TetR/AcrR family transcriptional regulator C-terminal domain-containing protein [Lachnospiraceae bacterium]